MVPDIALFAPAIRSVFGQYPRQDPRHIPFDITDLQERGTQPLLVALEWLLRLPQQRVRLSEVRDLLDVPAVAARFGLAPEQLPRLAQWMNGAGIRWGLDQAQREALGLAACGEQNSWHFGLQRMLLGYASGEVAAAFEPGLAFQGIEPYGEVGGLDAAIAGSLAALIDVLTTWWALADTPATPTEWAARVRQLMAEVMAPTDEHESLTLAALQGALQAWLEACNLAGFEEPVPLAVAREAWLAGVDAPGLNKRFRAGGVTFCTLLPMRAIPFEVVCLLGMNDGDYPRSSSRNDFDLMGQPGQQRPGDRSRRDDDRQLMLEALLSARRVLYVSWTGRSVRDNTAQPPSVLVSQLRDYLEAGWGAGVVAERSTEHPLQPFSRRYFEQPDAARAETPAEAGPALFTHASEWRQAHDEAAAVPPLPPSTPLPAFTPDPAVPLSLAVLARFLKNPVREFFRSRLDVVFQPVDDLGDDNESFALGGLDEYSLIDGVLQQVLVDWPHAGQPLPPGCRSTPGRWPWSAPWCRPRSTASTAPVGCRWASSAGAASRGWSSSWCPCWAAGSCSRPSTRPRPAGSRCTWCTRRWCWPTGSMACATCPGALARRLLPPTPRNRPRPRPCPPRCGCSCCPTACCPSPTPPCPGPTS